MLPLAHRRRLVPGSARLMAMLLLVALAGCASYRAASYPQQPERPGKHDLTVGARVRVTLATGHELYGRVTELTESTLTMSRRADGAVTTRAIPLDDIAAVEIEGRSRTREVLLVSFLALATAGGLLMHAIGEAMGGLN